MSRTTADGRSAEVDLPGDRDTRKNTHALLRDILIHRSIDGVAPGDCGPFEQEAGTLVQTVRQHGIRAARDALEELDGLRYLYDAYDPTSDALHPLADLEGMTGSELLRREFPPLRYLVEGVIPEG